MTRRCVKERWVQRKTDQKLIFNGNYTQIVFFCFQDTLSLFGLFGVIAIHQYHTLDVSSIGFRDLRGGRIRDGSKKPGSEMGPKSPALLGLKCDGQKKMEQSIPSVELTNCVAIATCPTVAIAFLPVMKAHYPRSF